MVSQNYLHSSAKLNDIEWGIILYSEISRDAWICLDFRISQNCLDMASQGSSLTEPCEDAHRCTGKYWQKYTTLTIVKLYFDLICKYKPLQTYTTVRCIFPLERSSGYEWGERARPVR